MNRMNIDLTEPQADSCTLKEQKLSHRKFVMYSYIMLKKKKKESKTEQKRSIELHQLVPLPTGLQREVRQSTGYLRFNPDKASLKKKIHTVNCAGGKKSSASLDYRVLIELNILIIMFNVCPSRKAIL